MKTLLESLTLECAFAFLISVVFVTGQSFAQSPTGGILKRPQPRNPEVRRIARTTNSAKRSISEQVEEALDRGNKALDRAASLAKNQTVIEAGSDAARAVEQAEREYTRASKLNPKEPRAYYGLGNVYVWNKPSEDVAAAYKKAVDLKPDYWEAYLGLARAYAFNPSTNEEYLAAVNAFKQVIRLKPDLAEAYSELGPVYESLARNNEPQKQTYYSEAEEMYKQAVRLQPNEWTHHYNLARNYIFQHRTDDAIRVYEQAVDRFPQLASAHYELASEYVVAKRYDEAIDQFKQAVRLNPNYSQAYLELAHTYDALDKYADALSAYKELLRIYPVVDDDPYSWSRLTVSTARFGIAEDYLALGDKKAALEQFEQLKKIDAKKAEELLKEINGK